LVFVIVVGSGTHTVFVFVQHPPPQLPAPQLPKQAVPAVEVVVTRVAAAALVLTGIT